MSTQIVVLGGGTGGVAAANVLRKLLPPQHSITVIDRRAAHQFEASFPLVLVGMRQPEDILRPLSSLEDKGIDFLQAEITGVDFSSQVVKTSAGLIPYDYLVISLGAEKHPQSVPGFPQAVFNAHSLEHLVKLAAALTTLKQARIVFFISHLPISGTVGPYEMILLLQDYFHRRGKSHGIQLTFVTPEPYPLAMAGPRFGRKFQTFLEERGIQVVTQSRILYLDYQTGHLVLDGGIFLRGDLFIGVPSHQGPAIFRKTPLSQDGGWLVTDPYTLATSIPRVYAIGDAVGIRLPVTGEWLPKAGIIAHYQGEVVARNIALEIVGKEPRFRFTGKAAGASIITSLGKSMLFSLNAYHPSGPRFAFLPPTRLGYAAKIAFEKNWLSCWF